MHSNRTTDTTSNLEQSFCNGAKKEGHNGEFNKRVCIHIHSIRKRLADPDGISAKAAIDGVVKEKILKDDSALYVESVTYSQEKGEPERTIITIKEVSENE